MRVYLAGPCDSEHRTLMMQYAKALEARGYEVYKPWELKIPNAWDYSQEDWAALVFKADIEAINNCDVMFLVSVGRIGSAGTNWEQGYAYGIGKEVWVAQVTNEQTSLMTFCGCTGFINADIWKPDDAVVFFDKKITYGLCSTTLT